MFVSVQDLIILGIGCISLIIWLGIFIAAKKYDELFEPLDEKEYALKELYSMGYFVMEKLKYNYKSRRDRKLRQDMEVLYEKKYVEYYLRVTYSRAVTYGMLLFVLAFVVYGLSGEMGVLWVMFMFSGVSVYYVMTLAPKKIEARSAALLVKDFFYNEEGDVNIVSMVVLIGIAVLLAVIFKNNIKDLLDVLFKAISGNAEKAVS